MSPGPPGGSRDGVVNGFHQFRSTAVGRAAAPFNDESGNPGGELLLTEPSQNVGEFGTTVGVEDLGGSQCRLRIHPHVQWSVLGVGKPTLGLIELHRGNPEIEQDPVNGTRCAETTVIQGSSNSVITRMHQLDPVAEPLKSSPGDGQRVGVPIQSDQSQAGKLGQEPLGMATGAEGGVDENRARTICRPTSEGRCQKLEATVQQDGNVPGVLGHHTTSGLTGPHPSGEVPVRHEPGVGEVRQGRFGQGPHQTGAGFRRRAIECHPPR